MRPKRAKRGLKRIDAALDALGRMGFPKGKVRRTVNYLLKEVYRGDDAWVFLEEDSYRVVIEALLEEQEMEGAKDPNPVEGEDAEQVQALDSSVFGRDVEECGDQSPTVCARDAPELGVNGRENCALLTDGHSTRIRPSCYGWTSEDDDTIVDALPPTTCKEQPMVQCSLGYNHDRKRKSRWDVKPIDKK